MRVRNRSASAAFCSSERPGIAVAFVSTVYGVGSANLVFLPLATKLRGRARLGMLTRELIIEGMAAVQEGLNPRLIEQKLRGFLVVARQRPIIATVRRSGS